MGSWLDGRRRDPVFLSQPSPTVLMSRDFVVRAATPSYLRVTEREEGELLDLNLFDAFPDNPENSESVSSAELTASLEATLRTGLPHRLTPIRYDIPARSRPGEFVEKRWISTSNPVRDGDDLVGVTITIHDVTTVDPGVVSALAAYQDLLDSGDVSSTAAREHAEAVQSLLALVESRNHLAAEVAHLRRALETRPTIDQAKGVIMADRRCSADEAFEVLRKLSMDTNVRLADVAAAVVYQASLP
jgi:hypothetical protein